MRYKFRIEICLLLFDFFHSMIPNCKDDGIKIPMNSLTFLTHSLLSWWISVCHLFLDFRSKKYGIAYQTVCDTSFRICHILTVIADLDPASGRNDAVESAHITNNSLRMLEIGEAKSRLNQGITKYYPQVTVYSSNEGHHN